MKTFISIVSIGLLWLITIPLPIFAQDVPFEQKGVLDLRVHYDPTYGKITKWPNPKKGFDLFLPASNISVKNYTGPATTTPMSIFKGFTIAGRWFGLLGEFAMAPGVIWEYQEDFSFEDKGVKYIINKQKLAKYPALLKRLQYAMPTALDFKLRLQVSDDAGNGYGIELFVYNNDHIMNIESKMPYIVTMAPTKWADHMNIGVYLNAEEALVKKTWGTLTQVKGEAFLDITKLTLPVDEFIAIANLYTQYEKDGKKLKDDYKMLEDGYTPPGISKPYAKADKWSKPYEPEIRTARVFNNNGTVGLRSGNSIVFESTNHWRGDSLANSSKFFKFRNKQGGQYEIFNAKGKNITMDGLSRFSEIVEDDNSDTYVFISPIDESLGSVYTTLYKYSSPTSTFKEPYYTQTSINVAKSQDRRLYNESRQPAPASSSGRSTITIGFATYTINFYPVTVITTDKNLHVIKTEKGYKTAL